MKNRLKSCDYYTKSHIASLSAFIEVFSLCLVRNIIKLKYELA